MAQSSILGGTRAPTQAEGRDADALGPSDTSDSGSDIQGERRFNTDTEEGDLGGATPTEHDSDSDAAGTGERGSATPDGARDGADIGVDRIDSVAGSTDAQELADVMLDDPDGAAIDGLAADDAEVEPDEEGDRDGDRDIDSDGDDDA